MMTYADIFDNKKDNISRAKPNNSNNRVNKHLQYIEYINNLNKYYQKYDYFYCSYFISNRPKNYHLKNQ